MNHHIQKSPYEKYFLLVSGNRWEKNNLRALIALDNLFSNQLIDDTFKVKITGSSGNDYRYKLKNKEKFEFLGYVDDDVLSNLYANAYCFIYPSLNEGFGYPPLEAMNYSVPVLASPFSAIPECCGDAVIYFNPFSIKEIENRILMILDENIHALYAQRAIERFHIIYEKQRKDLDALIDYIFEETKE
jgi:glycosyltransferase involved in cell wall biosynthesis